MFKDHRTQSFGQQSGNVHSSGTVALIKQIKRFISENKGILQEINRIEPKFTYKLYQPIKYEGIDQMFIKPLILRQIDQLMEQKQFLIKKKQALNFYLFCHNNKREVQVTNRNDHYSFLRTTWSKLQSRNANSTDKLDNLNKIVTLVKANLKNMMENQQNTVAKELQSCLNGSNFLENALKTKMAQQIQRLKMRNEDLQMKSNQLMQIIEQKNQNIEQLRKQLEKTKNIGIEKSPRFDIKNEQKSALRRAQSNPETQDKAEQQIKQNQLIFNGENQAFKITISSKGIQSSEIYQTNRFLAQIIEFIKQRSLKPKYQNDLNNFNTQVPCLNLNKSLSTNEASQSERYLHKLTTFIPIKSQRSCINNKQVNKTMITNPTYQEDSLNNQEVPEVQNLNMSVKKFNRKAQFPLTSDRFRKASTFGITEQEKTLTNQ